MAVKYFIETMRSQVRVLPKAKNNDSEPVLLVSIKYLISKWINMNNDIHSYKKKYGREITKLREAEYLCPEDKELSLRFVDFLFSQGLSYSRIDRYIQSIRTLSEKFEFTFHNATKDSISHLLAQISTAKYVNSEGKEKEYTEYTKIEFKKLLKKFYKWYGKIELVEDFKLHIPRNKRKLPDKADLPTPEDILKMIQKAQKPRDKCLISLLYETGARIGEIANIRLSDIGFNKEYATLKLRGKTGERVIPIRHSYIYLKEWYENHPLKNDSYAVREKEDFLFISNSNNSKFKPMDYNSFTKIIKRLGREAKINKRLNPHSFRHARASVLAKDLPEAQLSQYFGWVQGSGMASTYVHLSGRDIVNTFKRKWGLIEENPKEIGLSIKCPRCGTLNAPTDNYCRNCDFVLNESLALELERRRKERERFVQENYEVLRKIVQEWKEKQKKAPKVSN